MFVRERREERGRTREDKRRYLKCIERRRRKRRRRRKSKRRRWR